MSRPKSRAVFSHPRRLLLIAAIGLAIAASTEDAAEPLSLEDVKARLREH